MNNNTWGATIECNPFWPAYPPAPPIIEAHWIAADMILGNARASCKGSGICKVSVSGTAKESACGCQAISVWLVPVNECCIQVAIEKRHLSPALWRQHFRGGHIELARPIPLPLALAKALGVEVPVHLKPKRYSLYQDANFYHHYIDLQPSDGK